MPQFISPNLNQLARVGGIPVDQWGDEAIGPVGKWSRTDWPLEVSQALS